MSAKFQYILSAAAFTAAVVASIAPAAFTQTASDTVSFVNFENRSVGVYGNAEAKEDFKRNDYDKSWWYAMDKNNGENSKVVYDGEEHGNVLQLKYPKGCVGPGGSCSFCTLILEHPSFVFHIVLSFSVLSRNATSVKRSF